MKKTEKLSLLTADLAEKPVPSDGPQPVASRLGPDSQRTLSARPRLPTSFRHHASRLFSTHARLVTWLSGSSHGSAKSGSGSGRSSPARRQQHSSDWRAVSGIPALQIKGHAQAITGCCFSQSGRHLVTCGLDGQVLVWEVASGVQVAAMHNGSGVHCVSLSADATVLATGDARGQVVVWDAVAGQRKHTLEASSGAVRAVALAADGSLVAACGVQGNVLLWGAADGLQRYVLHEEGRHQTGVAFSPNGRRLASASDAGEVTFYDVATGRELAAQQAHAGAPVTRVVYAADGLKAASCGGDGVVLVWDAGRGSLAHRLVAHGGPVAWCSFSLDGAQLVSAGSDGKVIIWDAECGALLHTLEGHAGGAACARFSDDRRRVVSCGGAGQVAVWDAATGAQLACLAGHTRAVTGCSFCPKDGHTTVSYGEDGVAMLWDTEGTAAVEVLQAEGAVTACHAAPGEGRQLASCNPAGQVIVWDGAAGAQLRVIDAHQGGATACAFAPDGKAILSGGEDGLVKLWAPERATPVHVLQGHAGSITACAVSPDGSRLLSTDSCGRITVWDESTGSQVASLTNIAGSGVTAACLTAAAGSIVACDDQGQVAFWSLQRAARAATYSQIRLVGAHVGPASCCAVSSDGRLAVTGGADGALLSWAVETGAQLRALLPASSTPITACCLLPASRQVACTDAAGTVRLLDAGTGALLNTLAAFPFCGASCCSAAGDGSLLLVGGARGLRLVRNPMLAGQPDVGYVTNQWATCADLPEPQRAAGLAALLRLFPSLLNQQDSAGCSLVMHAAKRDDLALLTALLAAVPPGSRRLALASACGCDSLMRAGTGGTGQATPNAILLALSAKSTRCTSALLAAVSADQVTLGSIKAVYAALPSLAKKMPGVCMEFLSSELPVLQRLPRPHAGLPDVAAKQGPNEFGAHPPEPVLFPLAAQLGDQGVLRRMVETNLHGSLFATESVSGLIAWKWAGYARARVTWQLAVHLQLLLTFNIFTWLYRGEAQDTSLADLARSPQGAAGIALEALFLVQAVPLMYDKWRQLHARGLRRWLRSVWNLMDATACLLLAVILPMHLSRNLPDAVTLTIAVEALLLWAKLMWFLIAFRPMGALVRMVVEIVKDIRFFLLLMLIIMMGFGAAFLVLYSGDMDGRTEFSNVGHTLVTTFSMAMLQFDNTLFLESRFPFVTVSLFFIYELIIAVVLLNLLIAILSDSYGKVKETEHVEFLRGRALLIDNIESTLTDNQRKAIRRIPPYIQIVDEQERSGWKGRMHAAEKHLMRSEQRMQAELAALRTEMAALSQRLLAAQADNQAQLLAALSAAARPAAPSLQQSPPAAAQAAASAEAGAQPPLSHTARIFADAPPLEPGTLRGTRRHTFDNLTLPGAEAQLGVERAASTGAVGVARARSGVSFRSNALYNRTLAAETGSRAGQVSNPLFDGSTQRADPSPAAAAQPGRPAAVVALSPAKGSGAAGSASPTHRLAAYVPGRSTSGNAAQASGSTITIHGNPFA